MTDISIPTRSGHLAGVIHKPCRQRTEAVLIISHGFRGSKDGGGRAVRLAQLACDNGFTVVRFDFTPLQPVSLQVAELTDVVAYCRANLSEKIILLGRSMGGSASLAFAAKDRDIMGLCLWATPWDLMDTFKLSLGSGYERLTAGQNLVIDDEFGHLELTPVFLRDFAKFDLLSCVEELPTMPLLVLHGSDDEIVPITQPKKLFDIAKEPKEMVIIDGGNHQLAAHVDQASTAVLSWLKRRFLASSI